MSGGGEEIEDNWGGDMGADRGERGRECVKDLSAHSGNDPDTTLFMFWGLGLSCCPRRKENTLMFLSSQKERRVMRSCGKSLR